MDRVLATLVATALLIGCGTSSRAAYLASAEAHAAACAAFDISDFDAIADTYPGSIFDAARGTARFFARRAAIEANQAADAVGTDEFYPAVRKADATAADAWEKAQELAKWLSDGPTEAPVRAAVLKASRKAWEAAERAMASHD